MRCTRRVPKPGRPVIGLCLLALISPSAAAQMSVTTFGGGEAQGCFLDASDGVATDSARCDRAIRDGQLVGRDRLATLVNRGIVLNRAGRLDEALASFGAALDGDGSLPEAWINRGNTLFLMQEHAAALEAYRRSLEFGLRRAHVAWYNIGLVHEARDEPEPALAAWRQALELNPEFALAEAKLRLWHRRMEVRPAGQP